MAAAKCSTVGLRCDFDLQLARINQHINC